MNACTTVGGGSPFSPFSSCCHLWLLFFLNTHCGKLLLTLNLFVFSLLFVWNKHSTLLISVLLYIALDLFYSLAPTRWKKRKYCLPSLRDLGFVKMHDCIYLQEAQVHLTEPIQSTQATPYPLGDSRGRQKKAKCFLHNMPSVAKH